ncbi:LpqB family beta-propeller domain-containing protein [Demequina aurantiaca]|uniref:LpqB family beta-propeller domain-containing protein n=1 Tax=Demequina aurantiaca TaxID=676200 RepID=UPI0009FCA259|nr:LpqB family beta-propeller domain-containing protein [Demequina aurantiaca]
MTARTTQRTHRFGPRRMRGRLVAVVAAATLALAGCVSIPDAGPVEEGDGQVPDTNPVLPFAEGPQVGDSPTAIVSGFLTASAAGFASNFSVAREYLTPEASNEWDPSTRVLVFDSGALTPDWDEATNAIQYSVPVAAEVDSAGVLVESTDGTRVPITFQVVENSYGEYRISELDDGAVIAQANFDHLFLPVPLAFASMDTTTIVPDLRWLPQNNGPTWAARELLAGPSPWLASAVKTGFPAGAALEVDSVVVTDGIAAVQLNTESAGTPSQRSLAQEQLTRTLTTLPGVVAVTVTVGGVALGGDGSVALNPAPIPDGDAAAIVASRLGLWDGTQMWVAPDPEGFLPDSASHVARSYGGPTAAFLVNDSVLAASSAIRGGIESLEPMTPELAPPENAMEYTTLYSGNRLVGPSYDRQGWVWTAETSNNGQLVAVRPSGDQADIDARWLEGRTVQAVAVSRDGTRVVVLSREGGQQLAEVAAVVRTESGVPLTLGSPLSVGVDVTTAVDAEWINDLSFAILGEAQEEVPSSLWIATVGGETVLESATVGAKSVTARQGESSLTTVGEDGSVRTRVGTGWEEILIEVDDLEYAG